mmetsp:Transcript_33736/g.74012  ORF Transcript_33736/g.74012 Transcript_33736/m.74012 type:complete len:515 (+) Transcript_33736:192-1736(+)
MMKNVSWFGMGGGGGGGRSSSSRRLASVTEESAASSSTSPSSSNRNNKRRQQKMALTKRTASLSSLRGGSRSGGGNDQDDSKNDSTSTMSSHEDVLELYRGEIDDLRRQLRESQEARVREEEKEMQIVELRRQLDEARREAAGAGAGAGTSSEKEEHGNDQQRDQQQHTKEQDAEAVASAIGYLDEVIRRVSKSSSKPSRKQDGANAASAGTSKSNALNDVDANATPVKTNEKLVQLEFCPTLKQVPLPLGGGSKRTITPPPALAASDGDAEELDDDDNDNDSGSWHAAGAMIKLMADDMTSSSMASSTTLHTAADGMSSMHTAAGTSIAPSMSDASSSWLPVGKMAALMDDSTVNTTSNDTWMTAADDDLDDMQTCISALTSHTGSVGRSRGASVATATTATHRADDSAVVVAELYRIQSLLQSVLREREGDASRGGVGGNDDNSKNQPSIQRVSSRAKKIASLWENNLRSKEEEEKNEKTVPVTTTKQDKVEAAPLTKESAEQIITSLAGLF